MIREELREAMRRYASGVTIVTLHDGISTAGLTVSSFTSISLEPPVIMVSIHAAGSVSSALDQVSSFAVHLLGTEHEDLSSRFASSLDWNEKIEGLSITQGVSGVSMIDDMPTVIEATVIERHLVGTHTVLYGSVQSVVLKEPSSAGPLLYFDRTYRRIE